MKKTVVIGVTSGIAAYKALNLIELLKEEEVDVRVVMTKHATQMVSVKEFEVTSGHKVHTDLFEQDFDYKHILKNRTVDHIELADQADVMVIVPATANIMAKIAHGMADDFLTTTLLAVTAPVILCPSMNVNMWNNPAVQHNLSLLKNRGFQIIEPTEGPLACGYDGKGRLAPVEMIKDEIMHQLKRTQSLAGKKIIVTAGGTVEKIDDVRSITNRSSGKMGVALAEECYLKGAEVLLLRAKSAVQPRYDIEEKTFQSADELQHLIESEVKEHDIFFHTAAVSDFKIEKQPGKISSNLSQTLTLNPRQKILNEIKKLNPNIQLIAFKAEYGLSEDDLIKTATKRLSESNADAIVANDISKNDRGFQADTNEVFIVLKNGQQKKVPLNSKRVVASEILDFVLGK